MVGFLGRDASDKAVEEIKFVVAAAVGLGAIKLINWLVKSDRFKIFAIYTLALGGVVLLISIIEAIKGSPITFA